MLSGEVADLGFTLMRHLVTAGSAKPVLRGAHDRRHFSTKPEYRFDNSVPNRLLEQPRLNILSWNPGPRRGREGAIEEHIAVKWHVITLQEAIGYLQHECLTNHFYTAHFAGCAVLFQQGHLSLGHQCQVHLPPRQKKWATSSRERRTVRMGTTGTHLPCFVPKDSAHWQVLLYHDVAGHQQRTCQEARNREELATCSPYCDAPSSRSTWLLATLMVLHGAASRAAILGSSAGIEEAFAHTCSPMPPGSTPL